ncbi:MAG: hypothetical protein GY853_07760 [PVC group bacterium]|nr:hypothetical protein [PVC group bacterium]
MRKIIIACLLSLCLVSIGYAQDTTPEPTTTVQTFKAGGTPIAIPPPTPEMTEVGYDTRELMEIFVPQNNRLIAAFVLTEDLPRLAAGDENLIMSLYSMVQVPRRGEAMDCAASDFSEVTAGAKEQFGDIMNSSMKEAEDEFNRRMKALDLEDATMSMKDPVQIGCLFSKPDSYCFGMIMENTIGGITTKMTMGCMLLRVRNRMIFVYLYKEYENEETVTWLRKNTEAWSDAILAANKE